MKEAVKKIIDDSSILSICDNFCEVDGAESAEEGEGDLPEKDGKIQISVEESSDDENSDADVTEPAPKKQRVNG